MQGLVEHGPVNIVDGGLQPVAEQLTASFDQLHAAIPTMPDLELFSCFHKAAYLGKRAWLVQAHVLHTAKNRKVHQNDGGIRAVAEEFGISASNASGLIRVWEALGQEFLTAQAPYDHMIGVSWYKTVAYTDDPLDWLEYAKEKKETNPDYSIRDLRADIEHRKPTARPAATERDEDEQPGPNVRALSSAPAPEPRVALTFPVNSTTPAIPAHLDGEQATNGHAPTAPAAQESDAVRTFQVTLAMLAESLDGTDNLVYYTDPAELAAELPLLSEQDHLNQRLLIQAFDFLTRVFAAREERMAHAAKPGGKKKLPPRRVATA